MDDHRDDDARYLAVYVGTLGSALETTCRDLAKRGRLYQSLLLDAVGTAMLDAMASICDDLVDIHSRQMGLFTGCRLGPGLNGIALESQALIFDLLGGESAGVHLNEAFIMRPAKSISAFVIYSDSEQEKNPGSKCLQCEMKHCQFRSSRQETAASLGKTIAKVLSSEGFNFDNHIRDHICRKMHPVRRLCQQLSHRSHVDEARKRSARSQPLRHNALPG